MQTLAHGKHTKRPNSFVAMKLKEVCADGKTQYSNKPNGQRACVCVCVRNYLCVKYVMLRGNQILMMRSGFFILFSPPETIAYSLVAVALLLCITKTDKLCRFMNE